jgi:hypothetical protein
VNSIYASVLRNEDKTKFESAVGSYINAYADEFSVERDIHNLMASKTFSATCLLKTY